MAYEKPAGRPAGRPSGAPPKRRWGRRKICRFCVDKTMLIDYKNTQALRGYISERGKIVPRRISGTCAMHQRMVTVAIKRARNMALLPFTASHSLEPHRQGGRSTGHR